MSKHFLIPVILTLALLALVLPTPALAANVSKFSGDSADAYFSTLDETGCIYTDVSIFANSSKNQNPPGAPDAQASVSLWIAQYDACTATQLLGASGFAPLDGQSFQIDRQLNGATLNRTVTVSDYVTGATFAVAVAMTWSDAGPVAKGSWSSHYQTGKCKTHYRSVGTWRAAQASGTVIAGAINYAPTPAQGASLSTTKSGNLEIGCN